MTSDVEISNMSGQDTTVALKQDGKRRLVRVRRGHVVYFPNSEPTPELEALHRSKHMNVTFRVIHD